jgi:hypothetical protein
LRNAALPVVTLCGWELIRAVAGHSVVVETVCAWPGLGLSAIQAIERDDLILLQAIVFTVAILVVQIASVWPTSRPAFSLPQNRLACENGVTGAGIFLHIYDGFLIRCSSKNNNK